MMERRQPNGPLSWLVSLLLVAALMASLVLFARVADATELPVWQVDDRPQPVTLGKDAAELAVEVGEPESEWTEPEYAEPYAEAYVESYVEPTPYAESGDGSDFRTQGVVQDGGTTYTWYSQAVLPGGGLDIPGRNVNDEGYVCDGDGNICVASSDYEYGTELDTPFGSAVVYDTGCASGVVDIYTDWS